jgi:hypothetical protein
VVYFIAVLRVARISTREVARYLLPSSLAGGLMGIALYALRSTRMVQGYLTSASSPFLENALALLSLVLAGVVFYFPLLYVFDRSGFKEVMNMGWQILLPEKVRTRIRELRVKKRS